MSRRPAGSFGLLLAVIGGAAFLVRVVYVLAFRQHLIPMGGDPYFYSRGAELLVDGYGFIEPAVLDGAGRAEQAASHPPLYLLWLTVASLLEPGSTSQLVHMLWSCLLGTATVITCGLVGRELAGPRCGLLAAVGAAVYPNIWVYDGMLKAETMSLFLISVLLLLVYRFRARPNGLLAGSLGLTCGLATLSRAELILTLPLIVAPIVLLARGAPFGQRVRWLAVAGVPALLVVGAWVGFNFSRFEEPVYLTHGYGFQLIAANCEETYYGDHIGFWNGGCAQEAAQSVLRPGMDPSEREVAVRRVALDYVEDNRERLPVVLAARWGRITGLYKPWQQIELDQYLVKRERPVAIASLLSYYAVAVAAVAGAVVLRRRRIPVYPMAAFVVIVLIAVAMAYAETRYRAAAEVPLVLLAAVAVDAGVAGLQRRRRPERERDSARPGPERPGGEADESRLG